MPKKLIVPMNPMIYKVAAEFAGVMYETGRAQGMPSRFKTPEAYARHYIEKFIPLAVKHLMEMLKPHSGVSEFEKSAIYEALMDPVNDPRLMEAKVNTDLNLELFQEQRTFEKNKVLMPINSKKTVLHKDQ